LDFVQENHSVSVKGVLRGLHYQLPPHAQGKLVRVVAGAARDVAVDIRRRSPTFGKWIGTRLSASDRRQLWIPEGFAHGFIALEEKTEVVYKTTSYYSPSSERCIMWNDAAIGIKWGLTGEPRLSEKDRHGRPFALADVF
jgi:dTDP-4-dehydrorhamnose 3,5-epimerase